MIFEHWNVTVDDDHIAWWVFDKKDSTVNTLNKPVFTELNYLIDEAHNNTSLRGVIISSGKKSGFIAGADIQQFLKIRSEDEAFTLVRQGQEVFNNLASLKIPTVALIQGFCMGGGTELALACKYRVAEDNDKTRIGLPEVKLGLQPGWGGTIRLPLLIGVRNGLEMILSGSTKDAKKAEKIGLVDAAVPKRHILAAAKSFILETPPQHKPGRLDEFLNTRFIRPLFAYFLRKKVSQYARPEHYPAPYKIIDLWEKNGCTSSTAMEDEARGISELIVGDTSKNLVRVFFLQERLKSLAKGVKFNPDRIHVVGAGTMGGDIAAWCALRGARVTLQDREAKFIAPAMKRAYELFKYKLKEPRLIQAAMDRLMPDIDGTGVAQADIIIEAIYENAGAKQSLFTLLEKYAKPDAILATNTSSIPLATISSVMKNPGRLVGIHFFNPVAKMMLVEVVHGEHTDAKSVEKAMAFVRFIDKLPLPVKSAPGFLVNRTLMPYMIEAMQLINEGVAPETIDMAAIKFGMPMGPIELADTIGLDVCLSVAKFLSKNAENLSGIEKLVAEKHLGRKTGQGFYVYKNGKPVKNHHPASTDIPIMQRLLGRMIHEAELCLKEEIVTDSDLVDAGMIFGTGFAPFRGGPLHYAEKEGLL